MAHSNTVLSQLFAHRLYLLNATAMQLYLAAFSWAGFLQKKGGIEPHVGLDAGGCLPAFLGTSKAKVHELRWARSFGLSKGSLACFDRDFTDCDWCNALNENGRVFVTRPKSNTEVEYLLRRADRKSPGISNDHYLKARENAEIYRKCRQIELFFKWIKQNPRIKTFPGLSANAVLTRLWIALCVYLLVAFLNFKTRLGAFISPLKKG